MAFRTRTTVTYVHMQGTQAKHAYFFFFFFWSVYRPKKPSFRREPPDFRREGKCIGQRKKKFSEGPSDFRRVPSKFRREGKCRKTVPAGIFFFRREGKESHREGYKIKIRYSLPGPPLDPSHVQNPTEFSDFWWDDGRMMVFGRGESHFPWDDG